MNRDKMLKSLLSQKVVKKEKTDTTLKPNIRKVKVHKFTSHMEHCLGGEYFRRPPAKSYNYAIMNVDNE